MRIGLDLDGVFADFVTGHTAIIKEQTGISLPPVSADYPPVWDYATAAGLTEEQNKKVWGHIVATHNFWMRLKPIPEVVTLLHKLGDVQTAHEFYFITSRPGPSAKFQTEAWLMKWFHLPTVLIAADKAPIVKSLALELFVDDRPETVNQVAEVEGCLVLMPEKPWNRNVITDARVVRVKNLEKALTPILGLDQVRMVAA